MKKIFTVLFAALAICSATYAEETYGAKKDDSKKKQESLGFNEIIMVGSATVKVDDENFDFYAKAWGVTDFSKSDTYVVYGDAYEEVSTLSQWTGKIRKRDNGKYGVYEPGQYFLSKQKVKKGVLSSAWPIKWRFYSDPNFEIYLPFRFEASVPKGEKFVYVGDFEYHLEGSDFHVTKIYVRDNYDQAQEALRREFGDDVQLCRVEIRAGERK